MKLFLIRNIISFDGVVKPWNIMATSNWRPWECIFVKRWSLVSRILIMIIVLLEHLEVVHDLLLLLTSIAINWLMIWWVDVWSYLWIRYVHVWVVERIYAAKWKILLINLIGICIILPPWDSTTVFIDAFTRKPVHLGDIIIVIKLVHVRSHLRMLMHS